MPSRSTAVKSRKFTQTIWAKLLRTERLYLAIAIAVPTLTAAALPASGAQAANAANKAPQAAAPVPPAPAVPNNPSVPLGYRIGAGDVLQINVWRESEVSVQGIVVRP